MRYFLVIIFGCLPFFASSQVNIAEKTARYFLEQDDKAKIYEKRDSVQQAEIINLNEKRKTQGEVINRMAEDRKTFEERDKLRLEKLAEKDAIIEQQQKDMRRQKFWGTVKQVGTVVICGAVIVLTL